MHFYACMLKRQGTRHEVGVETIVEIGAPFNPEARNVELFGIYQRNMPRTVYSAVILDYLCEQQGNPVTTVSPSSRCIYHNPFRWRTTGW